MIILYWAGSSVWWSASLIRQPLEQIMESELTSGRGFKSLPAHYELEVLEREE